LHQYCFLEGNNAVFIRVQAALEGFHHFQHTAALIDKGCAQVIRGIGRWAERAGGEKQGEGERCKRGAARAKERGEGEVKNKTRTVGKD
jgi:hypothetical protein